MSEIVLRSLYIHPDQTLVSIKFDETFEKEDPSEESGIKRTTVKRTIEAPLRPKKGLLDDMKSLRRHGLAIHGIRLANEDDFTNWNIQRIDIAGDYTLKKSRVKIVMSVVNELTGKVSKLDIGQYAMYPKDDEKAKYSKMDEVTTIIEKIIKKSWNFLNGDQDEDGQFILFAKTVREPITV